MDKRSDSDHDESLSKSAIVAMLAIVAGLTIVSVYANWQHAHAGQIESAKVKRFTPAPSPSSSPSP